MDKKTIVIPEDLQNAIDLTISARLNEEIMIRTGVHVNYYKVMELMLYNYRKLAEIVANVEAYCEVEYHAGRKTFEAAPQAKGYYQKQTEAEIIEDMREARMKEYEKTKFGFEVLKMVIEQHAGRKEFAVVRMYYFGENLDGTKEASGKGFTWEQVAAACEAAGLLKEVKTARRWRNKIVNDMAFCMFGVPAALSAGVDWKARNDQNTTI